MDDHPEQSADQAFQVDLRGVVELLSSHLYSGPRVYVRELLQNAVDAVRARQLVEPTYAGSVVLEVVEGEQPTLIVEDDGIGLDQREVGEFLATIGRSSKRDELYFARSEFIGQFGVGLLSCFIVSDEVVVVTTSAKSDSPSVEWRGRADGTYSSRVLDERRRPGTIVYVRAREDAASWFEPAMVRELAKHYGELLPVRITIRMPDGIEQPINRTPVPWDLDPADPIGREQLLEYGRRTFEMQSLDVFRVEAPVGGARGFVFVLPQSPSPTARARHRVYLKGMLLSDECEKIWPDWAFFVVSVLDVAELQPTASREDLHDDEGLELTREALGESLRTQLLLLAQSGSARLRQIIEVHHTAMKALAAHDAEFLEVIGEWLPFVTNRGTMTLHELRRGGDDVFLAATVDEFQQVAPVASAQDMTIVNGGYLYDHEVLQRAAFVFDDLAVRPIRPDELIARFDDLAGDETIAVTALRDTATKVLGPFGCRVDVRKFEPWSLPTLYTSSDEMRFRRTIEQTREVANPLYSGLLDAVEPTDASAPTLCFNYENPLVQRLSTVNDPELLERSIELLYVQALLLGHHRLQTAELGILNSSLLGLIQWGADRSGS